jgi:hypothetical protein
MMLLFLFLITITMCLVGVGGILILRDYDNLAVYVSLLTFVLGKWTGLTGAIFYDKSNNSSLPCLTVPYIDQPRNDTSDTETPSSD